jgi:hypothetical protein
MVDERGDELGHMPYRPDYFTVLATIVVRAVLAVSIRARTELVVDPLRTFYGLPVPADGDKLWRRALPRLVGPAGRLTLLSVRAGVADHVLSGAQIELGLLGDRLRCVSAPHDVAEDPLAVLAWLADQHLLDPARTVFLDRDPAVATRARPHLPELAVVTTGHTPDEAAAAVAHSWALDGLTVAPGDGTARVSLPVDWLPSVAQIPTDAAALHREVQLWRRSRPQEMNWTR